MELYKVLEEYILERKSESLNELINSNKWNWVKIKKIKNAWDALVFKKMGNKKVSEKRSMIITSYRNRLLDTQNLSGGLKPLVDVIVERGHLVDDSPYWVDDDYKQVLVKRSENQFTVVRFIQRFDSKKDMVMDAIICNPDFSNRKIARNCNVAHSLVNRYRKELESTDEY